MRPLPYYPDITDDGKDMGRSLFTKIIKKWNYLKTCCKKLTKRWNWKWEYPIIHFLQKNGCMSWRPIAWDF
jgi:hypothetical protein